MSLFRLAAALSALCIAAIPAVAFDNSRSDNLAVYWGQNSYGATHLSDVANWQKPIDYYCQDDTINAIPIAFLNVFQSTGGFPSINLASTCNTDDNGVFAGTSLPNCTFLASAIEYCQSRGKIVTISLGGATGAASFTSAGQATAFGDTIWDLFLGGDSQFRPFGGAVLDGIDLDIEGGNTVFFDSFIGRIRQLASIAGGKRYYVTAAPQCPYPDAYLGTVLNLASFDAVYVQFYNNWCGLQNYNNIWAWDFASWDTWAKSTSVNPNVKIYIGAPASSTAAGSGYVDATTLGNIAIQQRGNYSSFGGVMLWDASQAYASQESDQTWQWRIHNIEPGYCLYYRFINFDAFLFYDHADHRHVHSYSFIYSHFFHRHCYSLHLHLHMFSEHADASFYPHFCHRHFNSFFYSHIDSYDIDFAKLFFDQGVFHLDQGILHLDQGIFHLDQGVFHLNQGKHD
ncbi:Glycoside Hydrolase Family 18 protein [Trametes cinnabarina]|uniref:chitinase n=1 Tax=Pycnoporus cinnabarinus TaxID=5643 RepID=A0A060SBU5_PYCCI|nr:Glycoside Hydrolase Family 18 protein [Trametes cinnabarina]